MIYILPGMGATSRMYSGPWLETPNIKILDWPEYRGEQTLRDVAIRVINENAITKSDQIAGSSLGGMVALEIASKLNLNKVYLFGSAIDKAEVNPLLRLLTPFTDITPVKLIQTIVGKYPNDVLEMFSSSDSKFIKSMCYAISEWSGFDGDLEIVKRIHGSKDKIIFCNTSCEIVQNAGHLIAMTHPNECIRLLD